METFEMKDRLRILVPEYVPLDNKGEEAIIRGYRDLIFPDQDVEFTVLDDCETAHVRDGIRVWPRKWFYAGWRTRPFTRSLAPADILNSCCSLLRHVLEASPWWVDRPPRPVQRWIRAFHRTAGAGGRGGEPCTVEAVKDLGSIDYVIAGHDGVLRVVDECHVLNFLFEAGFSYGILGTALPIPLPFEHIRKTFHGVFERASYFYTRNPLALEWASRNFPDIDIRYAPDPAFAMKPAPAALVTKRIEQEGLSNFFDVPVVVVSACETEVSARYGFSGNLTAQAKRRAHVDLLCRLVEHCLERTEANVLFLPHCVGPRRLDDRIVSRSVIAKVGPRGGRVRLLDGDCGARLLKGILARATMLISERVHALIAAVGVQTPFLCLGATRDPRYVSIIGETCRCRDLICYLDSPDCEKVLSHLDRIWSEREDLRQRLAETSLRIEEELRLAADEIRPRLLRGRRPADGHGGQSSHESGA